MAAPRRVIVLSDIHLGPGAPQTRFAEAASLSALLHGLDDEPTELVLAGDVFDFLQCSNYDGFDAGLAPERFSQIVQNPDTARVLDALAGLLSRPEHELVVFSGNHDPELILPEVRREFERRVGREGGVRWPDGAPLRSRPDEIPIEGYAVESGGQTAWITHGDRWDPHNFIDRRVLVHRPDQVVLPPGSRLVYEVLAVLKSQVDPTGRPRFGWVDELKPDLAVLLVLLYLDPVRAWSHLQESWGLSVDILTGAAAGAIRAGPLFSKDLSGLDEPQDLSELLGAALGAALRVDPRGTAGIEDWLTYGPNDGTLTVHGGVSLACLRAALALVRAESQKSLADADALVRAAYSTIEADILVAGHTHGPRALRYRGLRYLNSGTWLRVAELPWPDVKSWLDALDRGEPAAGSAPRSAALLRRRPDGLDSSLLVSDADGRLREVARD